MAAAATEIAGGVLTITGIADPAGPLAVAGAMAVAAALQPRGRPDGGAQRRRAARSRTPPSRSPWPRPARASTRSAPRIPGRLAAVGALVGGVAAGALIAKMVTSKPAPAEAPAAQAPSPPSMRQQHPNGSL